MELYLYETMLVSVEIYDTLGQSMGCSRNGSEIGRQNRQDGDWTVRTIYDWMFRFKRGSLMWDHGTALCFGNFVWDCDVGLFCGASSWQFWE